jgi:ribosomal protein S27E
VDDERKSEADEIGEILANDPNAHVVPGEAQAWLLTGKALEVARAALGRDGEPGDKPEYSDDPDPSFPSPSRPALAAKIIGQQGKTRFLIEAGKVDGLPAGRVYDATTDELSDALPIGSITAHSPGWDSPTASETFLKNVRERVAAQSSPEHVPDEDDTQKVLAGIAAEAGGELIVEHPRRTVAPMPTRTPDGSFVNRTCPHCGGEQFAHAYGDELCRCTGCGAELDVDELVVQTDRP